MRKEKLNKIVQELFDQFYKENPNASIIEFGEFMFEKGNEYYWDWLQSTGDINSDPYKYTRK